MKNREKRKLLIEIMALCLLIQEETDYCVFFNFSGHVNSFDIRICESEENWRNEICATDFYNKWKNKYEFDNSGLAYLRAKRDVLKDILDTGDIPYEEMEVETTCIQNHYF